MLCFQTNLMSFRHTHSILWGQLVYANPKKIRNNRNNNKNSNNFVSMCVCQSFCTHDSMSFELWIWLAIFVLKKENSFSIYSCAWEKTQKIYYSTQSHILYGTNFIRKWIVDPEKLTDLLKKKEIEHGIVCMKLRNICTTSNEQRIYKK